MRFYGVCASCTMLSREPSRCPDCPLSPVRLSCRLLRAFREKLLFLYFGFRMLKEGLDSHGGPSEELTEVGRRTIAAPKL